MSNDIKTVQITNNPKCGKIHKMLTHLTKMVNIKSTKTNARRIIPSREKQIELYKKNLENGALFLWQVLQESELSYEDYEEIREYIINLFLEDK